MVFDMHSTALQWCFIEVAKVFKARFFPRLGEKIKEKVYKGLPDELVGELDIELEELITKHLLKIAPVVGEESGLRWPPSADSFWVVDPLDGTHNYLMGLPTFGTMVAYVEQGQVVLNAVFCRQSFCSVGAVSISRSAGWARMSI